MGIYSPTNPVMDSAPQNGLLPSHVEHLNFRDVNGPGKNTTYFPHQNYVFTPCVEVFGQDINPGTQT